MRKTTENIKKFVAYAYAVYCVCYVIAAAVTLIVLYKDEIANFIKKVSRMCRRMLMKMTCFFKQVEDRTRTPKVDAPTVHMSDPEGFDIEPSGLEFAYSEE